MATAWYDGDTLRINIPGGLLQEIDVQGELYSDAKDWYKLSDNSKHSFPFDTTGGDETGPSETISPYFFMKNSLNVGWRLASNASDSSVTFTGNLFRRDITIDATDSSLGGAHFWETKISPQSLTTTLAGLTPSQQDIRDAMGLASTSGQTDVDTKLNNNFAVSAAAL